MFPQAYECKPIPLQMLERGVGEGLLQNVKWLLLSPWGWLRVAIWFVAVALCVALLYKSRSTSKAGCFQVSQLTGSHLGWDGGSKLRLSLRPSGGIATSDAHSVKRPVHENKRYQEENPCQHMSQDRAGS